MLPRETGAGCGRRDRRPHAITAGLQPVHSAGIPTAHASQAGQCDGPMGSQDGPLGAGEGGREAENKTGWHPNTIPSGLGPVG